MEDYGFSISPWQNTDSILSMINCLRTLYLFQFNIDIPIAGIDDRGLKAAIKHGGCLPRIDVYKNLWPQNFQKQGPILG